MKIEGNILLDLETANWDNFLNTFLENNYIITLSKQGGQLAIHYVENSNE